VLPVLLAALLFCLPLAAQVSDTRTPTKVIVLKDGRLIGIQGDFEIIETEVFFTDSSGRYLSLPLNRVDLDKTRERNEALARGEPITQGGSQPAQTRKPTIIIPPEQIERSMEAQEQSDDRAFNQAEDWFGQDVPQAEDIDRIVEDLISEVGEPLLLVLLVGLAITALISLVVSIYLIVEGFHEGMLWGMSLLLTFLCLGPLNVVLTLIFIIGFYRGNRLLVFFLWTLSFWYILASLALFAVLGVAVGETFSY
jgi:hypothetical protein